MLIKVACDKSHIIPHYLFTKTIMMPLAPTPIVAIPTKPKIGFSIDSIVGSQNNNNNNNNNGGREREYAKRDRYSPNSEGSDRAPSPASDNSYHNSSLHRRRGSLSPPGSGPVDRTPPPPLPQHLPPTATSTVPAPAILRPSPMAPHAAAAAAAAAASLPYHLNQQDLVVHAHNQHFLAAQFQVAAALAHNHGAAAAQNAFAHAAAAHGHHQPTAGHHSPAAPRDSYPLYPWLLSRHGRIFPHRFPGGKCLLLQLHTLRSN